MLQGGAGDDTLFGGDGNDSLTGGADNDLLEGGAGADTLHGGDGDQDIVSYSGSTNAVTVDIAAQTATGGDATGDILTGIEAAIGGLGGDTLLSSTNDDWLSGYDGNDNITGLDGTDILDGGAGADTLQGGNGADDLLGGHGNDSLIGGDGDDILVGGGSYEDFHRDFNFTDGEFGTDQLDATTSVTNPGGLTGWTVETITSGSAASAGTLVFGTDTYASGTFSSAYASINQGKSLGYIDPNTKISQAAAELHADGHTYKLNMTIGWGIDDSPSNNPNSTTYVDSAAEVRIELSIGGTVIRSFETKAGEDRMVDITLTGSVPDAIADYGNQHVTVTIENRGEHRLFVDNVLLQDTHLIAGTETDVLEGGSGADILQGGIENDLLTGGLGADVFLFAEGDGTDTITDFEDGIDILKMLHVDEFSEITISQSGADTHIVHDEEGTIILQNSAASLITSDDFVFI